MCLVHARNLYISPNVPEIDNHNIPPTFITLQQILHAHTYLTEIFTPPKLFHHIFTSGPQWRHRASQVLTTPPHWWTWVELLLVNGVQPVKKPGVRLGFLLDEVALSVLHTSLRQARKLWSCLLGNWLTAYGKVVHWGATDSTIRLSYII